MTHPRGSGFLPIMETEFVTFEQLDREAVLRDEARVRTGEITKEELHRKNFFSRKRRLSGSMISQEITWSDEPFPRR